MTHTKPPAHTTGSGRSPSSSSSSSSSSTAEEQIEAVTPSSSSIALPDNRPSATGAAAAAADMERTVEEAVSPAAPERNFTASEKLRQKNLFLDDAEQFAFDFGGEATTVAETVVVGEAALRAAQRAEELEDATARAVAVSAQHKSAVVAAGPLTVEEVSSYAAASLARGPQQFMTLPKAGAVRRRAPTSATTTTTSSSALGQSADVAKDASEAEGATLAEAMAQFKMAIRRYDEGLWRENKLRREEEAQKRDKARKRQRA
ncbi:hypothetical protein ABB37_02055 [Leptomonas pyrrhocoris]|uniref:Uncharacterized protein n=1 Tax=Leptomonas pyrrhocoris TaxID=157538 RepID=A0A0N0VGR7_LEPPY|nr:hypothetical protein ABB37_02055 [Leptomonas pyrrhocoris]XP_015662300.1 hypothetical protein ABB37_02055 [Leptomonas pyrrhocoris]KPA83860.1 hypothetical protein ABB37_02055 [Leptomonas pyrrhocoris]KPA83861.1 hypothetical protein ABB37_02055 [Leptomonas pyrrhocoris]|eukprot:XP_015662299.1 hypothetical protein ABB37_02055 [Leptomonas pyrrhocoris]